MWLKWLAMARACAKKNSKQADLAQDFFAGLAAHCVHRRNTGGCHAANMQTAQWLCASFLRGGRMTVVDAVTHALEWSYWPRMLLLLAVALWIVWKCVAKRLRAWACAGAVVLVAGVFWLPVWH